ncbi:MAG: VOC family protein [Pyrinomonadaceae bacterium]
MLKGITLKHLAWVLCCLPLCYVVLAVEANDEPVRNLVVPTDQDKSDGEKKSAISVWGVRYQVKEVERSIAFYTLYLGFKLEQRSGFAFASVSNGGMTVLLSGPGVRVPAQCRMDADKNRADGIGSSSEWMICRL